MSVLGAVASLPEAAIGLFSAHKAAPNAAVMGKPGAPTQRPGASAAAGSTGSSATGASSSSATDIGTTFLSLLVKELQNQDPTAPMDSTAMVGQMISLNQLDQLIAINQAVQPATTATTATTGGSSGSGQQAHAVSGTGSAASLAARAALQATLPGSTAGSGLAPLSPDATLQAAAASASNTGVLNLNNLDSIFGGK